MLSFDNLSLMDTWIHYMYVSLDMKVSRLRNYLTNFVAFCVLKGGGGGVTYVLPLALALFVTY